jgi:peptidoglycan/xylan/chitin deacetylase (PgdA/CDA1 family)
VNDDGDPFFPALPLAHFGAQLDHLARTYRVEPLDAVLDWLAAGAPGPTRVALTFDDGYPDTLECALPELERRGLPATLLLSTAPCETGEALWTDRVRATVRQTREASLEHPVLGPSPLPLASPAQRLQTLRVLLARLKRLGARPLLKTVDEIETRLGAPSRPPRVLSWDDVSRLTAGGFSIGGHTHRHLIVSRLDDEELRSEITTSIRLIEERLSRPVTSFAYPNGQAGDFDDRPAGVLRDVGVRCSLAAHPGFARPGGDPYRLPRLPTSGDYLPSFAARVAGLGWEGS